MEAQASLESAAPLKEPEQSNKDAAKDHRLVAVAERSVPRRI